MATPAIPRQEAQRRVDAVNEALKAGYRPPGQRGTGPGAVQIAANALGMPRQTLDSSLGVIHREYGIGPDWNLSAPSETAAIAPTKARPRVRIQARREGGIPRTKALAIGDAHDDPNIPKDRFRWMGRHAAEIGADWVVQIGDCLTLDSLNAHIPNDTLAGKQKNPFYRDLESGREALGEFNHGLGSHKPRKHVTGGNHERRAWTYEDANPESANLLTGPLVGLFEQHGWGWSEYGEFFFLGGVGFTHACLNRLGKTYGGKNAEATIANDALFDIVIGHSHSGRVWRAPKIGPSQFVNVVNLGCALPYGWVEDYARHSTTGWTWGAYELTISEGHIESASFISMGELERRYG